MTYEEQIALHRTGIEKDAAKAELTINNVEWVKIDNGGKIDSLHIFDFEKGGIASKYIQPYTGIWTYIGEHYAVLEGNIPAAVAYKKGFLGPSWKGENKDLNKALKKNKAFMRPFRKISWGLNSRGGTYQLDWTVQIKPLGNNKVVLMMAAGGYSMLKTRPGLPVFRNIMESFKNLDFTDNDPAFDFVFKPNFVGLALRQG